MLSNQNPIEPNFNNNNSNTNPEHDLHPNRNPE